MAQDRPVRHSRDRKERNDHSGDVRLELLQAAPGRDAADTGDEDKKLGDRMMKALGSAKMAAILSGMEIMYVFVFQNAYQCFIHKLEAEDGRHKAWPLNERNTAMIRNLPSAADKIFIITPKPTMDPMGVMVAAERGIISYLDAVGQLPADDYDFMQWQQPAADEEDTQ